MQRYQFCNRLNVKPWWAWLVLAWVASVLTELGSQCWITLICRSRNLSFSHWGNSVKGLGESSFTLHPHSTQVWISTGADHQIFNQDIAKNLTNSPNQRIRIIHFKVTAVISDWSQTLRKRIKMRYIVFTKINGYILKVSNLLGEICEFNALNLHTFDIEVW